ncbi:hypothetical protein FBEOM_3193 [Fusarium beomiforme]|uniref:Heterokaryon incompatibility domain-containing protein n=1 Tax=Fusarium beomiforme TaxID=44412 RepID=A0A9P5AQH3_9HYPO|nr:hypothetical protein FBEOM_3193 [Fusarium beomiforme]
MSETLCSDCSLFEKSLQNRALDYSHQTLKANFRSLHESAHQGCALCRLIYQSSFYDEGVSSQDTQTPIDIMAKNSTINALSQEDLLEILTVRVQQQDAAHSMYLPILSTCGGQTQAFEAHRGLAGQLEDPTSDEGLNKIVNLTSNWIQSCRNTHRYCEHASTYNDMVCSPTRLIDVGTEDQAQLPKLFIPEKGCKNLEYVALSYAWGPLSNFIKTTASNLEIMLKRLPFSELPKTIQEAIIFTRKLGFKYLWVDALCILQSEGPDDMMHRDDWSREATRFGDYYHNAVLTISATGAKSSDTGLFLPRPALEFDTKPVMLRQKRRSGETADVPILPKIPTWLSEVKKAPLYERGWAIQERMLSTRVVHFASNMILWECHERRATEIDQSGVSLREEGVTYEEISDFMPIFRDLQRNGGKGDQVIHEWYSFIEGYTAARFTLVGDRLPALSGIAATIQKRIPRRYGAGLWESAIPEGLAWLVEGDLVVDTSHLTDHTGRMGHELRLPSWSWAVSRGPVRFLSTLETWETTLQVEHWEVRSTGMETSGQVLGARLRVRGSLKAFDLAKLGLVPHVDARLGLHILQDDSSAGQVNFTRAALMDANLDGGLDFLTYACMLVGTAYITGLGRNGGLTGCALILKPTGRLQEESMEYRRIGFLCLPFDDFWRKGVEEKTIELS